MKYSLITVNIMLIALLTGCVRTLVHVHTSDRVKFAVVAVTDNAADQIEVEDTISAHFQNNDFDAVPGHQLVSRQIRIQDRGFRDTLLKQGVAAVLVLRPIEVGPESNIKSVEDYVQRTDYSTIEEFVQSYRGDDFSTRAVIEIGGFRLWQNRTTKIWQGVVWLDGVTDNRDAAISQLSELVLDNVIKWRNKLRESAGLPPLEE